MDRPDFASCKRSEARTYAEHLEATIEELRADLAQTERGNIKEVGGKALGGFARDSKTSRKAALENYPRSGSQRWRILNHIGNQGDEGRTRQEVAEDLGMAIQSATGRITELVQGGWVRADGDRTRKTPQKSDAEVLILTEKGRRERHADLEGLPPFVEGAMKGNVSQAQATPAGLFTPTEGS